MSAWLETNFVKTKYINPPIASLPLIFSNCLNFLSRLILSLNKIYRIWKIKKLIDSKLKKFLKIIKILFQTRIKFKAKPLSSQDKASRSQQN